MPDKSQTTETNLDWTQPIQFANGDPAELINANAKNFPDRPYAVYRPCESNPMCSVWFYAADGKGSRPENDIVNCYATTVRKFARQS